MKKMIDIIKSSAISIMMSCTIFVIVGIVFDQMGKGCFNMSNYSFTKMAIACAVTGLGFGVPSILYSIERIPVTLATIIQLGIGFTVYFAAASIVGWIPKQAGLTACILTVVGMFVLGIIIWFCFMKYYKNLADRMNKEILRRN